MRCGSSCAPRTVSVAAGATRLVRVRFKSNLATLRQIQKLTKHAPKKLRKRSKLFLKLVATDSGGARTKLNRRSALIPWLDPRARPGVASSYRDSRLTVRPSRPPGPGAPLGFRRWPRQAERGMPSRR